MLIELAIVALIESGNNPAAYNEDSGATGLYQITAVCLADYNQYHRGREMDIGEMYNPGECEKVAAWYLLVRIPQLLDHYGLQITPDNILFAYNAGIGKVRKGIMPKETKNYIKKYHAKRDVK